MQEERTEHSTELQQANSVYLITTDLLFEVWRGVRIARCLDTFACVKIRENQRCVTTTLSYHKHCAVFRKSGLAPLRCSAKAQLPTFH